MNFGPKSIPPSILVWGRQWDKLWLTSSLTDVVYLSFRPLTQAYEYVKNICTVKGLKTAVVEVEIYECFDTQLRKHAQ